MKKTNQDIAKLTSRIGITLAIFGTVAVTAIAAPDTIKTPAPSNVTVEGSYNNGANIYINKESKLVITVPTAVDTESDSDSEGETYGMASFSLDQNYENEEDIATPELSESNDENIQEIPDSEDTEEIDTDIENNDDSESEENDDVETSVDENKEPEVIEEEISFMALADGPDPEEEITDIPLSDITVLVEIRHNNQYAWTSYLNVGDNDEYVLPLDFVYDGDYEFRIYTTSQVGGRSKNSKDFVVKCKVDNKGSNVGFTYNTDLYEKDGEYYINEEQNKVGVSINAIISDMKTPYLWNVIRNVNIKVNDIVITQSYEKTTEDNNVVCGDTLLNYYSLERNPFTPYKPFVFSTLQSNCTDEGVLNETYPLEYFIEVSTEDIIWNKFYKTMTIKVDNSAPEVTGMYVGDSNLFGGGKGYSYFSNGTHSMDITVDDSKNQNGGYESGVGRLVYSIIANNTTEPNKDISVDNNIGNISLPNVFKGHIEAIAVDNVGNESDVYKSAGIVIEPQDYHDKENHISLSLPDSSVKDANGYYLYDGNTDVSIVLTDSFSGIKSVKWEISATYDTENNETKEISFSESSGGFKTEKDSDGLITKAEGHINVKNNSNSIHVTATMTDNAGNTSSKDIYLSIDKHSPVIETELLNTAGDATYSNYYKDNQFVKVTVSDTNFNGSGVFLANTEEGAYYPVSGFQYVGDGENGSKKYSTTVSYTLDGEYDLCFTAADLVNNKSEKKHAEHFYVDKTAPELNLSFGEAEGNGAFYRSSREMIISVTDNSFSEYRVEIIRNDYSSTIPRKGEWSEAKNTHTASVLFENTGRYGFSVMVTDKAGNITTEYIPNFVVDVDAPIISFTGVEQEGAYNTSVKPVVKISDFVFDDDSIVMSLTGAKHGEVTIDGEYEDINDGKKFTFYGFDLSKVTENIDDVYTITVKNTDLAGNVSEENIVFSINTLGSSYEIGENVVLINGKYVQLASDVRFKEINASKLIDKDTVVTVYRNGVPTVLTKGVDYDMTVTGEIDEYKVYEYYIHDDYFTADGVYEISVSSVDAAGNHNSNTLQEKNADMRFAVDNTAPVVNVYGVASDERYKLPSMNVEFDTFDNLSSDVVMTVAVNDEVITPAENNGTYSIELLESRVPYNIKISSLDEAGNETIVELKNVVVSQSLIVRLWNNKPARIAFIVGAITLLLAGIRITLHIKGIRVFTRK